MASPGAERSGLLGLTVLQGADEVRVRYGTAALRYRYRPNLVNQPATVLTPFDISGRKLVLGALTGFADRTVSKATGIVG